MVGKYAKRKMCIGKEATAQKIRMEKGNVCFPVYAKEREKEKMIIFFRGETQKRNKHFM